MQHTHVHRHTSLDCYQEHCSRIEHEHEHAHPCSDGCEHGHGPHETDLTSMLIRQDVVEPLHIRPVPPEAN